MNRDIDTLVSSTIRVLSAEIIQEANSGHPGLPLGMADCANILWTKILKHYPDDPNWINRDRFILSAGHGSALLYTLLHLAGYKLEREELKHFRQLGSRTAGHPEYGMIEGIETTTGPLGQGFANGIGMALSAKIIADRFNRPGYEIFGDHYIYGIVSDGDLMEGISYEAASFAGHLGLGNILYLYDSNNITIEGNTDLTFSDDVRKRFESFGWHLQEIDGHNFAEIEEAVQKAREVKDTPSLVICRTIIGKGSPNKKNTSKVHGAPLGEEEIGLMKEELGWKEEEKFTIPESVLTHFEERKISLKEKYSEWQQKFSEWSEKYPALRNEYEAFMNNKIPAALELELMDKVSKEPKATRALSGEILQILADKVPSLLGGSADLHPSNNTFLKNYSSISKGDFSGKNLHFGIREHAMGGILNGMALYGGLLPYGATFLVFSDYLRPAVRLASIMKLPVTYVFTHDSVFVGEDGPTHQPVEHINALRTIPNLYVLRPADGVECALSWSCALKKEISPAALILTRQKTYPVNMEADPDMADKFMKGAYIVYEPEGTPEAVIAATGSELSVAVDAAKLMEKNIKCRVVSVPCVELFMEQSDSYRKQLFPDIPKVIVEAGTCFGWGDVLPGELLKINIESFGRSGKAGDLAEYYGYTGEKVAKKISDWLA